MTISRLEQLVSEGGIIYGEAPKTSPSLQNYPQCDQQVEAISEKLWAGDEEVKAYGKGAVVEGLPLQDALDHFDIKKDVEVEGDVLWTHRSLKGMDIYFMTNQSGKEIHISPSFRVEGLKPQLWDAVTGEMRMINEYSVENGRTVIPLSMEADRSWFVVFTNLTNDGVEEGYGENSPEYNVVQTLNAEWDINFESRGTAPGGFTTKELSDWITSENDLLKYFSGTANYNTKFSFEQSEAQDVFIDLGRVGVMATVTLNGKEVGTTWMAPYRLNVSGAIVDGENSLEVKVVNVWRNRITGDRELPEEQRTTWVLVDHITPEEQLISSGLMGEVTIQVLN
ncbi:MAG: hypothetical protein GY790_11835 [Bacteroidetes bacterium]|nr:hypothetical protein [Bacteroidota bacterium]